MGLGGYSHCPTFIPNCSARPVRQGKKSLHEIVLGMINAETSFSGRFDSVQLFNEIFDQVVGGDSNQLSIPVGGEASLVILEEGGTLDVTLARVSLATSPRSNLPPPQLNRPSYNHPTGQVYLVQQQAD